MKVKLAAASLGTAVMVGLATWSAAADFSVALSSSTTVGSGTTPTSVCASQSTHLVVNGSVVVKRTDGTCTP
jgi:hypothetical protein